MSKDSVHWSEDPYWTEALDRYLAFREGSNRELVINIDAMERVIFEGDGPAYKAMDAMLTVQRDEGYEGFRGAPRVVCALLKILSEQSTREQTN